MSKSAPSPPAGGFSFRWGIPVLDAMPYIRIYHFLLDHYARLGVDPLEMMFIIHLAEFRFESPDGRATPSLGTIAARMGYKDEQQVRRLKQRLIGKGLLRVTPQPGYPDLYDVAPFAEAAFALWQAEQGQDTRIPSDTPLQSDTPAIPATPIRLDTPAGAQRNLTASPTPIQNERGIPSESRTPIQNERGPLSKMRGEKETNQKQERKDDSNPAPDLREGRRDDGPHSPWIAGVIEDFSRQLGDSAHWPANVTQAHRVWHRSGLSEAAFVDQLQAAYRRVRTAQGKQGTGLIANKMAYYFTVLADVTEATTGAGAGR